MKRSNKLQQIYFVEFQDYIMSLAILPGEADMSISTYIRYKSGRKSSYFPATTPDSVSNNHESLSQIDTEIKTSHQKPNKWVNQWAEYNNNRKPISVTLLK